MSDHHEYREELAAYAVGALDTAEKLEVERHVESCDACREYLEWLDPAVDLLPLSVEVRTPPTGLKRSIMGAVEEDLKAERKAQKARTRSERGLWGTIWRPVTAGFLSVVLVAGVTVGWLLRGDDPEIQTFAVESQQNIGPVMEASLIVEGDEGTLHVEKLPGLRPDQDYQAWIQHDGEMTPSSTFDVREDGEVPLEGTLEGAEGVYITLEPEGGSDEPTEPVLMGTELS